MAPKQKSHEKKSYHNKEINQTGLHIPDHNHQLLNQARKPSQAVRRSAKKLRVTNEVLAKNK